MEAYFRRDFGSVRVHADEGAAKATRMVGAPAFTVGEHVVVGAGMHALETSEGKWLLAHELAHVIQQQNAARAESLSLGGRGTQAEHEADSAALLAATGHRVNHQTPVETLRVQRAEPQSPHGRLTSLISSTATRWASGELLFLLAVAYWQGLNEELTKQLQSGKGLKFLGEVMKVQSDAWRSPS